MLLSSRATPLFKLVFPIVWVGGFASGTALMYYKQIPDAPFFLVATLLGASILVPLGLKLKTIEIEDQFLYAKGVRREIAVPVSEIISVHQKLTNNLRPAFIVFRNKTEFGKWIMFIPENDHFFKEDSAINFLRTRAGFSGEWRRDA
jgi:hypothetical protein